MRLCSRRARDAASGECRKEDGEKQHGAGTTATTATAAAAGSGARMREKEDKERAGGRGE